MILVMGGFTARGRFADLGALGVGPQDPRAGGEARALSMAVSRRAFLVGLAALVTGRRRNPPLLAMLHGLEAVVIVRRPMLSYGPGSQGQRAAPAVPTAG